MAARGSKSRKRSDASSPSKPPRDLVFFIDKCLGLKVFPGALRSVGERVEIKTDHFDEDTDDATWLAEVGKRGWIVFTADEQLRHNHIEIVALLKSNTYSFLLTSGNLTGPEMADAYVMALPDIKGIIATMPPPLVATVSKSGRVRVAYTHEGLMQRALDVADSEALRKTAQQERPDP